MRVPRQLVRGLDPDRLLGPDEHVYHDLLLLVSFGGNAVSTKRAVSALD